MCFSPTVTEVDPVVTKRLGKGLQPTDGRAPSSIWSLSRSHTMRLLTALFTSSTGGATTFFTVTPATQPARATQDRGMHQDIDRGAGVASNGFGRNGGFATELGSVVHQPSILQSYA
jgi:hypothetical protein